MKVHGDIHILNMDVAARLGRQTSEAHGGSVGAGGNSTAHRLVNEPWECSQRVAVACHGAPVNDVTTRFSVREYQVHNGLSEL